MLNITSQTTTSGNRLHCIRTDNCEFAHCLFEQALDLDIEPTLDRKEGTFIVEFIASDTECDAAIKDARTSAGVDFPADFVIHQI